MGFLQLNSYTIVAFESGWPASILWYLDKAPEWDAMLESRDVIVRLNACGFSIVLGQMHIDSDPINIAIAEVLCVSRIIQ